MKEKIILCHFCNSLTRHLTSKRFGRKGTGYREKRNIIHCTICNRRTIMNHKLNKTYVKNYG